MIVLALAHGGQGEISDAVFRAVGTRVIMPLNHKRDLPAAFHDALRCRGVVHPMVDLRLGFKILMKKGYLSD